MQGCERRVLAGILRRQAERSATVFAECGEEPWMLLQGARAYVISSPAFDRRVRTTWICISSNRRVRVFEWWCARPGKVVYFSEHAPTRRTRRRGAGVVERAGLENRSTGNRTVGSNPTLSAMASKALKINSYFCWLALMCTQECTAMRLIDQAFQELC
jgi:hypothetical protein